MIYHTLGEHANHYTTDAVPFVEDILFVITVYILANVAFLIVLSPKELLS